MKGRIQKSEARSQQKSRFENKWFVILFWILTSAFKYA